MPLRFEPGHTPHGHRCLRIHAWGLISLADAELLLARLGPGGDHHRERILAFPDGSLSYAPEARKLLPMLKREYLAIGIVLHSAIVRAGINLMVRIAGDISPLRMFAGEDEALTWLDTLEVTANATPAIRAAPAAAG
ncbi:MAG TPA: hypothetical protein VGB85_32500 [Nannocystis sp.]|jgi:uncharacterized heparinase superfamily protein